VSHNVKSQPSGNRLEMREKPTGQPVTEGEVITIVESMKMEVPRQAVGAGTVISSYAEGEVRSRKGSCWQKFPNPVATPHFRELNPQITKRTDPLASTRHDKVIVSACRSTIPRSMDLAWTYAEVC